MFGKNEYVFKESLDLDGKKYQGFMKTELTDEKCIKCKSQLSKVRKSDIEKNLIKIDKLDAFYGNYQYRCPKGDLHEIINDKCKKCGYMGIYYENKDRKFYERYRNQFEKIQKEKIDLIKVKIHKPAPIHQKTFPKWKITNSAILEFAKKFGVSVNFIFNIGLNENNNIKAILNNKANRYISSSDDELRVQGSYLVNYILMMFQFYHTLKYHQNVIKMPPELEKIYKKENYTLPNIYDDFNEKADYYREVCTPREFSNFLLNFLVGSLLQANKKMEKTKQKKMLYDFTKMIMKKIETAEISISKPKKIKFADLSDGPVLVETSSYDEVEQEEELGSLDEPDKDDAGFAHGMDMEDDTNLEL